MTHVSEDRPVEDQHVHGSDQRLPPENPSRYDQVVPMSKFACPKCDYVTLDQPEAVRGVTHRCEAGREPRLVELVKVEE